MLTHQFSSSQKTMTRIDLCNCLSRAEAPKNRNIRRPYYLEASEDILWCTLLWTAASEAWVAQSGLMEV